MTAPARYALKDGVARITMDDGKLNVMSLEMLQTLHAAFDQAAREEAIVVLGSGREGVFSAGFDLRVFAANDAERSLAMVRSGAELALKVLSHPLPVITACSGHAYPMGAFLILASDIRIAAEGAWRIGLNEVAIGIPVPSFALELARQRLVPSYLQRTALTGEMFAPEAGLIAGFFDRLVPAEQLPTALESAVQAVRTIHLPSHAIVKRRLRGGAIQAIRATIDAELTAEAYRRNALAGSSVKLPKAS
jgi:enoyl-CoA hydratase